MTKQKKFYNELNIFRAFLIIWVVIGHSFDSGADFFGMLHSYAYTFHMAGFFLLSGLLFAKKVKASKSVRDKAVLIGDRAIKLLVPYFFFTTVSYALKLVFGEYANNQLQSGLKIITDTLLGINNPNGGLWFLHNLFVFSTVAIIINFIPDFITFLFLLAGNTIYYALSGSSNIQLYYSLFFFLGIVLFSRYERISAFLEEKTEDRHKLYELSVISTGLLISSVVIFISATDSKLLSTAYFKTLYALFNIAVWYLLSFSAAKLKPLKKPLSVIGNYGMDIYMLGYYVQIILRVVLKSMLSTPYLFYSICMMVFGLLLPIPISKFIVRKFKPLSFLCLGNYQKKNKK